MRSCTYAGIATGDEYCLGDGRARLPKHGSIACKEHQQIGEDSGEDDGNGGGPSTHEYATATCSAREEREVEEEPHEAEEGARAQAELAIRECVREA